MIGNTPLETGIILPEITPPLVVFALT